MIHNKLCLPALNLLIRKLIPNKYIIFQSFNVILDIWIMAMEALCALKFKICILNFPAKNVHRIIVIFQLELFIVHRT